MTICTLYYIVKIIIVNILGKEKDISMFYIIFIQVGGFAAK